MEEQALLQDTSDPGWLVWRAVWGAVSNGEMGNAAASPQPRGKASSFQVLSKYFYLIQFLRRSLAIHPCDIGLTWPV